MQSVALSEASARSKPLVVVARKRHPSGLGQLLLLVTLACSGPSTPLPQETEPPRDAGVPEGGRTIWYFGGPVVPNPKVYVLWWGPPAQINPDLTRADGGMVDFFTGVTNSEYLDGLNQYNTDLFTEQGSMVGHAGTHQHIGRGNFAGAYTLDAGTDTDVDDSMLTATLAAALLAGDLPASDENAIYAIFFPSTVTVSIVTPGQTFVSCGNYEALHYFTPPLPGGVVAYLVIPDCGLGFDDLSWATAHELVETMTDRLPTPGNVGDYPQAWETLEAFEVADLCQNFLTELSTPNGSFQVQEIWDEEHQTCALTHAYSIDYSVSLNPNVTTLVNDTAVTVAVQTAIVRRGTQELHFSVRAPPGITATLTTVTARTGEEVSLTVRWDGVSTVKDGQVVVEASGGTGDYGVISQIHTASLLVNAAPGP